LKIGFDAKRAFCNSTGLGNYSRTRLNALMQFFPNNEFHLFTPRVSTRIGFKPFSSENSFIHQPQSTLFKKFPSFWRSLGLVRELKKQGIEIYHGLSNELPPGIEKSGIKSVVTIHDLIFLRYKNYYPFLDRLIYKRKFESACRRANAIIATSEQTKSDIISFFGISPSKINVIYQDCDSSFGIKLGAEHLEFVRKKYKLNKLFILSVGTIEQRKNQLRILKAFRKLDRTDLSLVFIGKHTEYTSKLHSFVKKQNMKKRVQFIKNVDKEDLPAIYQLCNLFVMASEFEGFGIPVLEALRSGAPLALSNCSSLPEIGSDAALYFNPMNIDDIAEKMQAILVSDSLRTSLIEKGNIQAQKFNSSVLMEQLMNLYKSL